MTLILFCLPTNTHHSINSIYFGSESNDCIYDWFFFKLVIQAACTRGSSTFTVEMAMEYSHMQETSDSFQVKESKLLPEAIADSKTGQWCSPPL